MCTVSMVMEQWRQPSLPNYIPWHTVQHDPVLAAQMLEVLKKLEAIDKRLGLLEQCKVSEPDKEEFKRRLKEVIDKA